MSRSVFLGLAAAAIVCGMSALSAHADSIVYTLGVGDTSIGGYPGPYATVTVFRDTTTTARLYFVSETNGGNIYLMGNEGSVAANINAASWSVSAIAGHLTGFTLSSSNSGGAGNEGGFGSFDQTINSNYGFTYATSSIGLWVTNTSGTWATAGDVLIPNADGYSVAAHVFVTSNPANVSNGALATGFVANGNPVPLPAAAWTGMSVLGLLGVGSRLRKKLHC